MLSQQERYRSLHLQNPGRAAGLGWGSERSQFKRFQAAAEVVDLRGLQVLDVGCGYGDFVPFLLGKNICSYTGIDLLSEYLLIASHRWNECSDVRFQKRDVFEMADKYERMYDVVFALGAAGLGDLDYLRCMMAACYRLCTRAAIVSITTAFTPVKKEDILIVEPWSLAQLASEVTRKFVLRHDYLPTDQMVYLLR